MDLVRLNETEKIYFFLPIPSAKNNLKINVCSDVWFLVNMIF